MLPQSDYVNPYVPLVSTKPDSLLPCLGGQITQSEIDFVGKKVKDYERIFLELGSGSGAHLIELAQKNPKTLLIGFELRYKRAFRTVEKAEKLGITNLLVVRSNALQIDRVFSDRSLDGIYVNFPDPWDKRRWKKHRLINSKSLELFAQLLKDGGFLSYKSDHREYFEESLNLINNSGTFCVEKFTFDLHSSPLLEGNIFSEFERLFISKQIPVSYLHAKKIGRQSKIEVK